jgi:alkanesulfonate monooxygenase SsuD/methylene tetrahydromethanopterin reductase-like flavin-dependent oxidoreductase (luciferase family)
MIAKLREASAAELIANDAAWVGTPDEIAAQIDRTRAEFGAYEHASLQVNFNMMPLPEARASLRLFAEEVMPRFTDPL